MCILVLCNTSAIDSGLLKATGLDFNVILSCSSRVSVALAVFAAVSIITPRDIVVTHFTSLQHLPQPQTQRE